MQDTSWIIANISGAKTLIDWYGSWPTFHDAEILELFLDRRGKSWIKIHTWLMTREIEPGGKFVLEKHLVITFEMENVNDLELSAFSQQNVISGLEVEPAEGGIKVLLEPCYGLTGYIVAGRVSLMLLPGKPADWQNASVV
jgi:Immunity protein 50